MNKTLLKYLKKRLTTVKGKWLDELPVALCAYRTTLGLPTGETPYALLAFGVEAWIPIKSGLEPLRAFDPVKLAQSLDELEKKREHAAIRMAKY